MTRLPTGWRALRLGEVLTAKYGKSLDKALRVDGAPFPVVGSAGTMATTPHALITEPCIVIGRKGNIGEARLFPYGCWPIDTTYFVEIPTDFTGRFLELGLEVADLRALDSSTTTPSLRREDLEGVVLTCPPLAEQDEIVRLLDTQLTRLDTAMGVVQAVRDKADQFRRALLHAAFTGQLTQPDPGREGAPSDWEALTIADSLEVSIGGVWGAEVGTDEADVDVIRVTELKSHGRIDPSTAARRSITFKQLASRELQEGDLLLEKSGGGPKTPVGRVGLVPQLERQSVCANFMMLMRADRTRVEPRLLHLLLNHLHREGATVSLQKATTNIRNLKTKEYLQLEIHLPNVHEQPHLLHELETQLGRLGKALEVADAVERECGRLRRSLLQAAFTGELTRKWREANG